MTKALQENLEIRQSTGAEGGKACAEQSKMEGFLAEDLCLTWVKEERK